MEIKEIIEILNIKLLPCFENILWKGQRQHPDKTELIQALTATIKILGQIDKDEIESFLWLNFPDLQNQIKSISKAIINYLKES